MSLFLIYGIFIFAFLGNLLIDYNFLPNETAIVTEVFVYLLFVVSILRTGGRRKYNFHLLYFMVIFLIVALCSIILNHSSDYYQIAKTIRLICRYYIFYLAMINLQLDEKQLKKINLLLLLLFLVQLPTVALRFASLGISEETIGTWGSHGGGLTAIIPIIAISYFSGFYIFHKARFLYILCGVGFILMGVVGAKRVLFIIYPLLFLGIYFVAYFRNEKLNTILKFAIIIPILLISFFSSALLLSHNRTLNQEKSYDGGSVDYSYAFSYTIDYTNRREGGIGYGRLATSLLTVETLYDEGLAYLAFGYGPSSLSFRPSNFGIPKGLKNISMSYGKTGMVYMLAEFGVLGLLSISSIFIYFTFLCYRCFKNESVPYWQAFSFGSLFFAFYNLFIFFGYNRCSILGDIVPPLYFYSMSTIFLRYKNQRATVLTTPYLIVKEI